MSKRDLAASVRQRLLNHAHAQGRPFQELLQYYAIERFLYRLAQSSHCDKFIDFLAAVREDLVSGRYEPKPNRRVDIPKGNGKVRTLQIPASAIAWCKGH